MNREEFFKRQQQAMEEMRKMNMRANPNSNPPKTQTSVPLQHKPPNPPPFGGLPLSIGNLLKEKDTALILGLLLILFSENADKRLLFALIYILI